MKFWIRISSSGKTGNWAKVTFNDLSTRKIKFESMNWNDPFVHFKRIHLFRKFERKVILKKMTDCQNNEIHVPSWWQFGLVLMFGVVLVSIVYGLGQLSKILIAISKRNYFSGKRDCETRNWRVIVFDHFQ